MYAIIVLFMDNFGSIFIIKVWKTANGKYQMKKVSQIETSLSSFTTFASTILTSYSFQNLNAENDFIALVTPSNISPQYPKIWVLNETADTIMQEEVIELNPNSSETKLDSEINKKY